MEVLWIASYISESQLIPHGSRHPLIDLWWFCRIAAKLLRMCSEPWELRETCLVDKPYIFLIKIFSTLKILPFPSYLILKCVPRVSGVLWIIHYAVSFTKASIFKRNYLSPGWFLWKELFFPLSSTFSLHLPAKISFFLTPGFSLLRELASSPFNFMLKPLALAWFGLAWFSGCLWKRTDPLYLVCDWM